MKIAIIGFGAAALGLLEVFKNTCLEVHIFEKAVDIYSTSVSGIRADGKLFVSQEMGGDLPLDLKLQHEVVQYYLKNVSCPQSEIEVGESFTNDKYYHKFYEKGFQPVKAKFWHIGTDELKNVLHNIYSELQTHSNLIFHFNTEIASMDTEEKTMVDKTGISYNYDRAYVCVGRSGHKLIKTILAKRPQFIMDNTKVDLGIRFELPNHIVQELNTEMYEFKVRMRAQTGYTVRTFCNNPSGFVVTEHYDDFVTVNGHAKKDEKTDNTNFAILVTHSFTQPFNDPISYGSYIAKLSNVLAGGNKVILQTYHDFKNSKRTKYLNRVIPTLDSSEYILGDLNLVFPSKTSKSIIDFLETLNEVVPGVTFKDNLLYGTEVKFYSNKLNNNYDPGISFIGDCSGWTRSITYATAHGILAAKTNFPSI